MPMDPNSLNDSRGNGPNHEDPVLHHHELFVTQTIHSTASHPFVIHSMDNSPSSKRIPLATLVKSRPTPSPTTNSSHVTPSPTNHVFIQCPHSSKRTSSSSQAPVAVNGCPLSQSSLEENNEADAVWKGAPTLETDIDTGAQNIRISKQQVQETDIGELRRRRLAIGKDPDHGMTELQERLISQAGSECELRVANSLSRLDIPQWLKRTSSGSLAEKQLPKRDSASSPSLQHSSLPVAARPSSLRFISARNSNSSCSVFPSDASEILDPESSPKRISKVENKWKAGRSSTLPNPVLQPINSNIRQVLNTVLQSHKKGSLQRLNVEKQCVSEVLQQETTTSYPTQRQPSLLDFQPRRSVTKVKRIRNITAVCNSKEAPSSSQPKSSTTDASIQDTPLDKYANPEMFTSRRFRCSAPLTTSRKAKDIDILRSIIHSQPSFTFMPTEDQRWLFRIESKERIIKDPRNVSSPLLLRDKFLKKPRIIFQDYFINNLSNLSIGRDAMLRRTLICGYSTCRRASQLSSACGQYHGCYNCFTYYCSTQCREQDWPQHRGDCTFGRLKYWSNQLAASLTHQHKLALANFVEKCTHFHGKGSVMLTFCSAADVQTFVEDDAATDCLMCPPFYCSVKDLALLDSALLSLCNNYDPKFAFVVTILVAALSNAARYQRPRLYKHCVLISHPRPSHEPTNQSTRNANPPPSQTLKVSKPYSKEIKDEFASERSHTVKRTAI